MIPDTRALQRLSRAMGLGIAGIGGLVLIGWAFDVVLFKSVVPGLATMKANTAMGFVLLGSALALLVHAPSPGATVGRRVLAGRTAAALALLLGLLTLTEYIAGRDFGIDETLFRDSESAARFHPGRMSPPSAFDLVLLAGALLLLDKETRRGHRPAQFLALVAGIVSFVAAVGYAYSVTSFYRLASYTGMALHSSLAFGIVSVGIYCARPDKGIMHVLLSSGPGGAMARRFLPIAILVPVVLGWFRLEGQRAGLYGTEVGVGLLVTTTATVLVLFLHRAAGAIDVEETRRRIGEQKSVAEALRQTEEPFRLLVEGVKDYAILMLDPEGRVASWNLGAQRIKGYRAEEILGRNFSSFYLPEDVEEGKPERELRQAAEEGQVEDEGWRVRKDGSRFWANVVITALRGETGEPRGFVKVTRDVTERREQYRRIEEANRLKSEFLANMSHELRTPLNAIIGFSELIHDGKAGVVTPDQKEYLGDILTSSRHLLQLINDVLDLSKVEAGKMEFRPESVDIRRLTAEVRDILRSMAAAKRLAITLEISSDLEKVVTDPSKLKQVLYNYLSNALKFTPDEGAILIRAMPEGVDRFRLEVRDNGIGIRPEDLGRLFVEFQQLDTSAAKKYPGTGLGLALTKRIVEAQGGQVGVESNPGKGSVFFAVLPRTGPEAPPEAKAVAFLPEATAGAPRVLVIEDDARDRAWMVRTLGAAGFAIEIAATGLEALQLCQKKTFDAITLDLLLPDVSGGEVLRTIRSGGPNAATPVIIVSVMADKGLAAGFRVHDMLQKPVPSESLLASLRRAAISPGASRPILVVDNDITALKLAEETLKRLGYRTLCRAGGQAALEAAEAEPPAAVILDLLMPGMDGLEFLRQFRATAHGRRTPVIVWTVKDVTRDEREMLRASAAAIVLKTEGTAALVEELRALVPRPEEPEKSGENEHGR